MPKLRRSAADMLGVLLAGALSASVSGRAAFAAPLPASLQVSFPTLLATKANAPRLAAADKQKVPKPPPARTKPDEPKGGRPASTDDATSESDGNCLESCLLGFGSSLFEGPTPPPAAAPSTAFASEAARWPVGASGWLVALSASDTVALFDAPAEPERAPISVGSLPHGAHVVVVETHAMAGGFWTRVRPFDGVDPNGWIPSGYLSAAAVPRPAPPRPPRPDPRWGLRLIFGGAGVGPAALDVEYRDAGVRADLQYMRLSKQWITGFGFGYRNYYGTPPQAYLSGTTLEDPQHSRLQIYEIGTRAGQRYGDRSGFRFDWMLGPTLAWVDERANLNLFTVVPPGTLVSSGQGEDALGRLAGGGEFRANFAWHFHKAEHEFGLHLGAFMFAWEGHEEHSLATDFVHSNIHGWDVSLSVTFMR